MISLASGLIAMSLAASIGSAARAQTQTGQNDKAQQPSTEQPMQRPSEFKLLILSNGITASGNPFGGRIYATTAGVKVYLYNVYCRSRESVEKEYHDRLKVAAKIIRQDEFQVGKGKAMLTEHRAVLVVTDSKRCGEVTTIMQTVDSRLRIIQSCSADAVAEFENEMLEQSQPPGHIDSQTLGPLR